MAVQDNQPEQLRRALFGIHPQEVADLQALLADTEHHLAEAEATTGRERARADALADRLTGTEAALREVQDALAEARSDTERERARADGLEQRISAALVGAEFLTRRLDAAMAKIAGLIVDREGADGPVLGEALRELIPERIDGVTVTTTDELDQSVLGQLTARESHTLTWSGIAQEGEVEHPLEASAALAGDRVVMVHYLPGTFDDGGFAEVVERLAHAVASSLQARALAREHAATRRPRSLLGGQGSARRFQALREAAGEQLAEIGIELDPDAQTGLTGVWGAPAWDATYFDLATRLDQLTRALQGEAFEIGDGAFACLVATKRAETVQTEATAILQELGLKGNVTSRASATAEADEMAETSLPAGEA